MHSSVRLFNTSVKFAILATMKAIILAAGKGKRMGESSEHTPKPLLIYQGKSLLRYKLENLPDDIEEVVIIIGHLDDLIIKEIGETYTTQAGKALSIQYIEQGELLGTAHSLWQAKNYLLSQNTVDIWLNKAFLVLMGDDIYSKMDLETMVEIFKKHSQIDTEGDKSKKPWVALVQTQEKHFVYGKCIIENGLLKGFINDHDEKIPYNTIYTGACLLTTDIFELPMQKVTSIEYGLPQTFIQEAQVRPIHAVEATFWKRITSPEDLKN
jgi:NDP-sugar pyrophosphorylase family protein